MAEALLISKKDLQEYTSLNANTDVDKVIQFVLVAQNIWIQQYTGSKLLDKIKTDITNNTLSGNYITLVRSYLKPMLIHFTMVEYLPFCAYTISNKGIYKHQSENSEIVSKEEVDYLIEKEKRIAESYSQRFLDYICKNNSLFPEYTTNENGDVYPQHNNYLTNWYL
jgi:hypothetical protein